MWLISSLTVLLLFVAAVAAAAHATEDVHSLSASLRFPRHKHLREDDWKEFAHLTPRLKRWDKENNTVEHDPINMEEQVVKIEDASSAQFTVGDAGFELVDLHPRLLPFLRTIKREGLSGNRIGPTTAGSWNPFLGGGTDESVEDRLAHGLQGRDSFSLGGDTVHYAFRCAGFVIRKGGPEGSKLNGTGFDNVAQRVHIDQDIQGEPLISMGLTWVFRLPYVRLLNIWSPLHDVRLRPMAFADRRSVDVARDVVRYRTNSTPNAGGRLGSFRSDRLMSMYSPDHKWYWFPNVRFGQAIAFDTSNVPHSSFTLPGEQILSTLRNDIVELAAAHQSAANEDVRQRICGDLGVPALPSDYDISVDMDAFIGSATAFKRRACAGRATASDFEEMLEFLTRASLEIRCVTLVVPRVVAYKAAVSGVITVGLFLASIRVLRRRD